MKHVIEDFMKLYHDYNGKQIYGDTYYRGIPCLKCPMDMWMYQEIIYRNRPDLIIETGSYMGASALYMADLLDVLGGGYILSVDIVGMSRPNHSRIKWEMGSSSSREFYETALAYSKDRTVMVILDSDHSKTHVLNELNSLGKLATVGQYLIVEDTNVNGHPVFPKWGDGPFEAVREFLKGNTNFVVDESCEKFLMTFNPGGYLKRVK